MLWLAAGLSALIIALMYWLDAAEIRLMPPRGTASLWPLRILTDFGKSAYVLWALAGLLFAVLVDLRGRARHARSLLLGLGTRLQFMFLAVLVPVLAGEVLKWAVGRGRPFVGGEANAFHFSHFHGSEAYQSLPSGHAITAFALAFAVSALWPRLRFVMLVLRRRDRGDPPRAAGPSPERRGRGRAGRRDRRDVRALLVRRAAAWLCHRPRRHGFAASGTILRALQKGCPQPVRPIISGRRKPGRFRRGPTER